MQTETIANKPLWHRALIVFFSGAACSIALPPYNLWLLFFAGFTTFYMTLRTAETPKRSFVFGCLFGFGYFLFGLNWIGNALLVEGNEFWWVWPLAFIALPVALSVFTGVSAVTAYLFSYKFKAPLFPTLCFLIALAEFLRGHLFTGFPWNLFGYIWSDNLLIAQSASVIGPYGLTLLTLLWASLPISILLKRYDVKTTILTIASIIITLAFGAFQLSKTVEHNPNFQVQIVQPNVLQKDKWDNTKIGENFNKHVNLSERQEGSKNLPTAIIWPETALHPILMRTSAAQERLTDILEQHPENSFLLTGSLSSRRDSSGSVRYFNNITAVTQDDDLWPLYSKSHLVPFGEYIPFQNIIPLKTITQFSGFERGDGPTTIGLKNFPSFSPFICYETIFSQKVVNNSIRPEWLLNATNDGWYGNSPGPYQHFSQSRMRAIEQGLTLVRAANTGVSGIIDPYGRSIATHDLQTQGLIVSTLPKAAPPTIYSQYKENIFWLLMIGILACILYSMRTRRQ